MSPRPPTRSAAGALASKWSAALALAFGCGGDLHRADAILEGDQVDGNAGVTVAAAGDHDGDGRGDVAVGAHHVDGEAGAVYLYSAPLDSGGALGPGEAIAALYGSQSGSRLGYGLDGGLDVTGDGAADLLIGAAQLDGTGGAWLVPGPISGEADVSAVGLLFSGEGANDHAGLASAFVGDLDGDGAPEVAIGAWRAGEGDPGAAYLFYGPVTAGGPLSSGLILPGERAWSFAGHGVAPAGDVDGDGYDDLLVGALGENSGGLNAGAAYLLYGPVSAIPDLASADARIYGAEREGQLGHSTWGVGDVDGDGRDDVLVGAHLYDDAGTDAGGALLYLDAVEGALGREDADAWLPGEAEGDSAGLHVGRVGDVDGDGIDDLLIGAHLSDRGGEDAGAAWLWLGPIDGDRSPADAAWVGSGEAAGDRAGYRIAGLGDLDGDGADDLAIGAWGADRGGDGAGAAYLFSGGGLTAE